MKGVWEISPMFRTTSALVSSPTSLSSRRICPPVYRWICPMQWTRVLLPEPENPTRARCSPGEREKLMSSSSRIPSSVRKVRFFTSTAPDRAYGSRPLGRRA